ncbi:uncharacterized protein LOC114575364 [Exaiptasia diaphana]|uniref:Uncharacterized protein n=1 Tax=Exaiptasia diaphana TaxID=2652724 RepID=A0A913YN23_EXADI|nr:uncharacterized protein LOC114575364 [Exaiptasia diaphana]
MEASHALSKCGNVVYSGGKKGCIGPVDYQKNILAQQMKRILLSRSLDENIETRSTNRKAKKKLKCDGNSTCEVQHKKHDIHFETFSDESSMDMDSTMHDASCSLDEPMKSSNLCYDDNSYHSSNEEVEEDGVELLINEDISVHVGCNTEKRESIEHLQDDLLRHSEEYTSEATLTEINFETAKECVANLGSLSSYKAHIDYARVGSIEWLRQDTRVSVEVFQIVFHFTPNRQLVIEHQSPKDKKRQRIIIAFDTILGLYYKDSTSTIALHICEPAKVMSKFPGNKTWQTTASETTSFISSSNSFNVIPVTVRVNLKSKSDCLKSLFKQDPALQRELKPGKNYSSSPQQIANTEKWFPILKHPNLVRAAQLASLSLLEETKAKKKDLQWLLLRYFGLERRFNELLKSS